MKYLYLLALFFLFPLASGKIIFTEQPLSVYNLGDKLEVSFYVEAEEEGYVEAYLECEEETLIFKTFFNPSDSPLDLNIFARFSEPEEECSVQVRFGDEEESSDAFKVSEEIEVEFSVNGKTFLPLETIKINGTAVKENGEDAEGVAVISIEDLTNQTVDLSSGEFSFEYTLSSETPAENYSVNVRVVDKDDSYVNYGKKSSSVQVLPKPSHIEIVSDDTVKPPVEYTFLLNLLDQDFNLVEDEMVLYKIYDPLNELYFQDSVTSGSQGAISFKDDALKKGWKINAYFGNVFNSKQFFVEENKKIAIEVFNSSDEIKITNVGNTEYEGVVKVLFLNDSSDETVIINVNLSLGESATYLVGLIGLYNMTINKSEYSNIEINEPLYNFSKGLGSGIFPTGAAIGVSVKNWVIAFALIVLLLVFIVSVAFFTLKKTKSKKESHCPPIRILDKSPELDGKRIYTLFLNLEEKDYLTANKIISKMYKLHKMSNNLYFIMFYAKKSDKSELALIHLVKTLKSKFPKMSSIIHSEKFDNKASSIKSAFIARQLINYVEGNFLTEEIYKVIKEYRNLNMPEARSFNLKERVIKLYEIKN